MSKELTGTVVLKRDKESSKFSNVYNNIVVFPMEVRMKCIQTDGDKVMCQHPRYRQIWMILDEKDIKNLKWE